MPVWLEAGLWGALAGGALVVGAVVGYELRVPQRLIAWVMAFGAGVLISALAFDLVGEANQEAGPTPTALGFLAGAVVYVAANRALDRRQARHRKRSGDQQPSEGEAEGSGRAIALGALLDGIPESIAIGITLIGGGAVSVATVAAIFLSNLPEGLSSAAGMRRAGRRATYVYGVWGGIALASGVAALLGYGVFSGLPVGVTAATTAVAAGGILAMVCDTMIPEAFERTSGATGLVAALGFLAAFVIGQFG